MKFVIPVIPIPKGRPRFTRRGFAFTPQKTRVAQETIKWYLKSTFKDKPLTGALQCVIRCVMPIPASLSKKKQGLLAGTWHMKRPDVDNILKLVLDSANGILWYDDAQISILTATKEYGRDPRIEIELDSLFTGA